MNQIQSSKVRATHLKRSALLYVRQSTMRQVVENTESTQRQYALRQRAVALGWPEQSIVVIDGDQGQSGASTADRLGFQRLVSDVSMGRAGLVMGLEVSRLARNNADWHRLLHLCAQTDTLILDEEGIYEPAGFNDRLLLGLKGAMSEAELHVLSSRLRGGVENKAKRGELKLMLPVGFVYDERDRVVLDPDVQVRESIQLLFTTFARTGSASATVRYFNKENLGFPRRRQRPPNKGELLWSPITIQRVINTLHNPRYAGAYAYGRRSCRRGPDARMQQRWVAREDWRVLLPNAHPGYITWEQYLEFQEILQANARVRDRLCGSPAREGSALLQGLILCGVCGSVMTLTYDQLKDRRSPRYLCLGRDKKHVAPRCQSIRGAELDAAVAELVVQAVSPTALETSLDVQRELSTRIEQADQLRYRQVERAQIEANLARRRFLCVDPENRLVAHELEADYNDALRALAKAREDYERQRELDKLELTEELVAKIRRLATDFPRLWNEPTTPDRERKRMIRLIIEDVTLTMDSEGVTAQIRFRGGATRTLRVPHPPPPWEKQQTSSEVIELIDQLLDEHTTVEIASILNEQDLRSGAGNSFHGSRVARMVKSHGLQTRFERLRARGLLTADELAARLNCSRQTIYRRRLDGVLPVAAYRVDDNGCHLYDPPP